MPSTVLEALEEDGTYPNLYFGMNLLKTVPQDLYKQAWWYRTTFQAPRGYARYTLQFPGINYRAEIWLNGQRIADSTQIVGMYTTHEIDASRWIHPGSQNTLAIKVIPEQKIQDVDGVELADSWHDWINWKYLGFIPPGMGEHGVSLIPDRNAGVFKPVYLHPSGSVTIENAAVNTELPLPRT
ncbi:MAG: sugar-binding domain-containing protein, partial [Bryocella sp.]